MLETMYAEEGVGLAAEQVGRTESVCVVDVPAAADKDEKGERLNPDVPMPLVLINPKIVEASDETATAEEGCLSFPGIYAPIARPAGVRVRFLDRDGKQREYPLKGLVGRAVQHEMDHLAGVLIVDRMSPVKKIALSGRLKRLRKDTQAKHVVL